MTLKDACALLIVQHLGYMPAKGDTVMVPKSVEQKATLVEQTKAKTCAWLHGIKWKIVKDR
jgi:hypothetical protein